ncbi:hypothetical protein DN752_23545 [Echinicola strongylocentroti]|uniref:Alpha-galactosidase n=1 Tax=Echinicola strongylocentroti TaxID=1795355 RepID=A0A2Z4IRF6_9BACT|nr:alpha-galactosidase [Echinicola strongylocentroti]AWW32873.1 hypothetical protein DN752_23545 [Echinicola strongylocentroti]
MNSRRNFIKSAGLSSLLLGTNTGLSLGNTVGKKVSGSGSVPGQAISVREFMVEGPLFCPYHSVGAGVPKGGCQQYYHDRPFVHNPFTLPASGMSGSPVIMDVTGRFFGFKNTVGFQASEFEFDGRNTLKVHIPAGQELFVDESGNSDLAWKAYNKEMMERLSFRSPAFIPGFWKDLEYCTWVEQKYLAQERKGQFRNLNADFVKNYLKKVRELGYPTGKFTLDHGWARFPDGDVDSGFGSWQPDKTLFPDFERIIDHIASAGFTPGIWVGFPKIQMNSTAAKIYPNLLGNWGAESSSYDPSEVRYLNPYANIYDYAHEVFAPLIKTGIRKLKIDMSYNTKSDMLLIHREMYRAIKDIDQTVEVETHVPDIFFAPYTDVIRTNDIWLDDRYDWPCRVETHYEVAFKSAPSKLINLDHIGGNDSGVITEEKYLKHLAMYEGKRGYPLVSILPHHISQKCADRTGDYLWQYAHGKKLVTSDFYLDERK